MEGKFVLPKKKLKHATDKRSTIVRLDVDAYNTLIDISNECTLPLGKIASLAIQYAYQNLAFEEEEE